MDVMELAEAAQAVVVPARAAQQPGLAVTPLCNIVLLHDPTGSTLTATHLLLVQLALQSHAYAEALPVIGQQIFYFQSEPRQPKAKPSASHEALGAQNRSSQKLKYQDVLEYFLGVGTIYIGLRQWDKALDALEHAITYPVKDNAVSKIMVDAYKKWVLVKILIQGKAGSLPIMTNPTAAKAYHIIGKPYDTVATLFQSATAKRLRQEVIIGEEIWSDDCNTGLMHLVLASYQKFQIRNLSDVYRSLSIADVTQMTQSAEPIERPSSDRATELLIFEMIACGDLHGSVSTPANSTAILTFSSTGPLLSEREVQLRISASMDRLKSMSDDIKGTDRRLTHDKEYLKWAKNQKKMTKSGGADSTTGEDLVWAGVEDEDLMGGPF